MVEQEVSCLPVVTGAFLVGIVTRAALATAGLGPSEELTPTRLICAACSTPDTTDMPVRREPRAGGIPLCPDCMGRTSVTGMSLFAD